MTKINHEEYEILKDLDNQWKWIARDEDGVLGVYDAKVVKTKFHNFWIMAIKKKIDSSLFSFIQWSDSEPYNIAELVEGYESEETEVKKDKEWLKKELNLIEDEAQKILDKYDDRGPTVYRLEERLHSVNFFRHLLDQLDEPEVLSQEWIDKNKFEVNGWNEAVHVEDLQNLLVPKQEEVDRAYKAGYETGKQHTFYKGYLEGLADKGSEPETIADVVTTFWKSYERLKEVMSMEVEELEE